MTRAVPFLQVAVNGSRSRADHSAVPVTPQELAQDVLALSRLGVTAVHLHVLVLALLQLVFQPCAIRTRCREFGL